MNHWQISGTWIPRDFFGRVLSLGSGSLIISSWTMTFSLIARPSGSIVVNWGLQIDIPPRLYKQAEAVNKVIMNGLKKRLDDAKGKWVKELFQVLWTYRITPCRLIGETLSSMAYGVEAVITLKTGFPTLRTSFFTSSNNDGLLRKSLDLIEERRENAIV